MLSVGGWTGSQYFSTAMGSAANRTAFVHAVLSLVKTYDLDGIDFEYADNFPFRCRPYFTSLLQLGVPGKAGYWLQYNFAQRQCQLPVLPAGAPIASGWQKYHIISYRLYYAVCRY